MSNANFFLGIAAILITIIGAMWRISGQFATVQTTLKHFGDRLDEIRDTVKEVDSEARVTQTKVAYLEAMLSAKGAPPNGVSAR